MYEDMAHALQNAAVLCIGTSDEPWFLTVDGKDTEQMYEGAEDECLYTTDYDTGMTHAFEYDDLLEYFNKGELKIKVLTEATW